MQKSFSQRKKFLPQKVENFDEKRLTRTKKNAIIDLSTFNNHTTMHRDVSINEIINGEYEINELWYDWFCHERYLQRKGENLIKKFMDIIYSKKFDNDKCYIFFKNNCPLDGSLYDDFRICDKETGNVLYTVIPSSGYNGPSKRKALVYGHENDFEDALVIGSWRDVKNFFMKN